MIGRHRWTIGLASGGILGIVVSSGIVFLANSFVEELSQPHVLANEHMFTFQLPAVVAEPPLALRRPVSFRTQDGKILRGDFWAQPLPAPTVIICHGYRVTRNVLRPVAALEYSHGFNILLFDFRGHGESERVVTSGGNAEVHDLGAAVDVAVQQPETLPGKIIIHGFSMGASIALLMRPRPEIMAIVADSPYARLDEILQRLVQLSLLRRSSAWSAPLRHLSKGFPALSRIVVEASKAVFLARFHYRLIARPETSFGRWQARRRKDLISNCPYPPILLIHSRGDQFIPFAHARKLVACARAQSIPLTTYFVECAGHCGAYGLDPEGYIQAVGQFMERFLDKD